jgi:hypothetical protein
MVSQTSSAKYIQFYIQKFISVCKTTQWDPPALLPISDINNTKEEDCKMNILGIISSKFSLIKNLSNITFNCN